MDDLDLLVLKRQLAWDMVNHADLKSPENQARFGLSPSSPDVTKQEHADSHFRIAHVMPCYQRLKNIGALAATLLDEGILNALEDCPDDDERRAIIGGMLTITAVAAISDLIDKGLLVPTYLGEHFHA